MNNPRIPRVLTIAGSDSGAGAGIQADLKTFGALGVFGTCAVTTITAQNTLGVAAALPTPAALVEAQIDAIMADIGADAVKTGILPNADIIGSVAQRIASHSLTPAVIDPVLVSRTGARILDDAALEAVRAELLPLATVLTPNTDEARLLTGAEATDAEGLRRAAGILVHELGAGAALVKGGRLDGPATDVLYDGSEFITFTSERIETRNNHGTGCTLASAIAAGLAHGRSLPDAVQRAKDYVTQAIRSGFLIGSGNGPLNHFHQLWQPESPSA